VAVAVEHIRATEEAYLEDQVEAAVINFPMAAQEHKAQADQQPVMDSQEEEAVKYGLALVAVALAALAKVPAVFCVTKTHEKVI
jgi:hypothetical protein